MGKRICPTARHWLLITAFSPETHSACSFTFLLLSLPFLSYPFITDSQREAAQQQHQQQQRWQQRCLSRIEDCNELILFSLQLHNCPGFLSSHADTHRDRHTHTLSLSHTHIAHAHTGTCQTLLSSLSAFTRVSQLLHHSWPFSCIWLLLPFFIQISI